MSGPAHAARLGWGRLGAGPQVVAMLLVVGLVGAMAIEPTRQLLAQRSHIDGVTRDLTRLERSNVRLGKRIVRLNDPDFIDQLAREQIGLVKPGEVPYVVMPPSRSATARRRPRREPVPRRGPPARSFVEGVLHFIGL